jgi:hypothetical protein
MLSEPTDKEERKKGNRLKSIFFFSKEPGQAWQTGFLTSESGRRGAFTRRKDWFPAG